MEKPTSAAPASKQSKIQQSSSQEKQAALKGFREYQNFVPSDFYEKDKLLLKFPRLFELVPVDLRSSINNFAEFRYGAHAIDRLNALLVGGKKLMLLFRWTSLGFAFGAVSYYSDLQHYFYFTQSPGGPLKGLWISTSLPEYIEAAQDFYRLMNQVQQLEAEIKVLQEEVASKSTIKENIQEPIFAKLESELAERIAMYESYYQAHEDRYKMVINFGENLTKQYKIHLMPIGDLTPIIIRLLRALKDDPELQKLINSFKVMVDPDYIVKGIIYPRVVIYPSMGKENAQKALNKIYALFKHTKGLNQKPRFNAKVTDLIWIAQGDSIFKGPQYEAYYELPNKVYYRSDLLGTNENYHLMHPETGKEIE